MLSTRTVALLVLLVLMNLARPAAQSYSGISESLPTGSEVIVGSGLVTAYDMETLAAAGRLRDFSGNGHHGVFSTEARDLGAWNPGDLYPTDACYIGFESHQGMESHRTMPFIGAIDEVLLFSRAWTAQEVRAFAGRDDR